MNLTIDRARELAATVWQTERTRFKTVDPELLQSIAEELVWVDGQARMETREEFGGAKA